MRKLALLSRLVVVMLCFISIVPAFAQEKSITGTVRDTDNKPVEGATVKVIGTSKVAQTNSLGVFTIKASKGQTIEISFIGFENQRMQIGDNTNVSISLKSGSKDLDDVVVVAMDLKRKPRELGYSVARVSGAEIQETQRENFINGLQGRVAGLTVNSTGGAAGASTSIVLRGFNSMALDNQPLFVIDGIIMDNQTVNETSNTNIGLGLVENSTRNVTQTSNRGSDYTNRMGDLNPNDIESITILKGPEATALYGSQASSGAIVITTKKAKPTGKLGIFYDNSFRISTVNRLPETSNTFSGGTNGAPAALFTYFGPAYAAGTPKFDNVKNFFKTGFAQTHNLSAEYGKKNVSFRISGSVFDQSGVIPNNDYKRYNVRISNTTKIGKYVDISPSVSYTHSLNDKPLRGQNGYLLNLLVWPVENDVRDYLDVGGNKKTLYTAAANAELDNPFWNVYNNRGQDVNDRYVSSLGININPFSWLSIAGRFGYDTYKGSGYSIISPLSYILTKGTGGQLDDYYRKYDGYNHTITVSAKKKVGDFLGRVMVGNMWQDYKTQMYSIYGTNLVDSINSAGQMVKNGVIISDATFASLVGDGRDSSITRVSTRQRLSNAAKGEGMYNYSINRQVAFFGELSLSYKNLVFLSYSHRFETSSIFPKDYRNYNYPAGSLSMIMSDIFPEIKSKNGINYFKLRTSLASTARSSAPYANQSVFASVTSSGGGYAYGFNNNNYYLEPERQQTFEIGTEFKFLNNKISFEATYYNTLCKKQIAENFRASYATGYVLNTINVGTTRNEGVELSLELNPIQKKDFMWNVRFSFNKMWNKVVSLPDNVPEFYISDTWLYANARAGLITGGSTTSITANGYARNTAGDIIIDPATGLPTIDGNFKIFGDRNPSFTLGTLNTFKYKSWSLSFLWDLKVGGDIFNGTDLYLTKQGKSVRTEDRYTPRVVAGVLKDGKENTATPTRNTIAIVPAYVQSYYTTYMPEEEFIQHNVNWFRLRDLTLSYGLPTKVIRSLKYFKTLSVFATASDLVLITNYTGADPSVNGNTAGTRGVGAWGFDYGNIGAPIGLNFGIRASF